MSKHPHLHPAVVIPVYKPVLTPGEKISLEQCLRVLGSHPLYVVKPASLDLSEWQIKYPALQFRNFDDAYFASIAGYNRLMVSREFYLRFTDHDYILIHQLDAFVFSDRLLEWCAKGYDYVGAPALEADEFDALDAADQDKLANALDTRRRVLNGGFSLRNVHRTLRYLSIYDRFYSPWPGNEDMLFSLDSRRLWPMRFFIKIPHWKQALDFAFEKSPKASIALNAGKLPFGCHAWERYDPAFWKKYIQ